MIKACEFIKTGFSTDDAEKLNAIIAPLFDNEAEIVVDFSEITIFTTLFFNNVFAKYIIEIGPEAYNKKFSLTNLSELGQTTYQHSFDNAVNYYNMSDEGRAIQTKNLDKLDD